MDFAEACGHACHHLQKRRRNKDKWSAERFVPDQRVSNPLLVYESLGVFTEWFLSRRPSMRSRKCSPCAALRRRMWIPFA